MKASGLRIRVVQAALLVALFVAWHLATRLELLPRFFFGEPLPVLARVVSWFATGVIWAHLGVTLLETALSFLIGGALATAAGLALGLSRFASEIADPYIKALNAMPRVILAPIFAVWFGLGVWSKVALGVTLVFFVVFFNVYQGVREVSPELVANARMLGASGRQLVRHVYLPSATAWVFSSLHTAVGMAFVGAVVGEYLGSARGVGYLIHQAEGVFDIDTVLAGILVLTVFALLLDGIVTLAEARLHAWRPKVAEVGRPT